MKSIQQLSQAKTVFLPKAGKQPRETAFLGEMETAAPWSRLEALAEPHYLKKGNDHPFRALKKQFGFTKVRYRGFMKNSGQIVTLFALASLWFARKRLLPVGRTTSAMRKIGLNLNLIPAVNG